MPDEIDFSKGVRGKFYPTNIRLNSPLFLDADVKADMVKIAASTPLSE
jgi:hypothetical protein